MFLSAVILIGFAAMTGNLGMLPCSIQLEFVAPSNGIVTSGGVTSRLEENAGKVHEVVPHSLVRTTSNAPLTTAEFASVHLAIPSRLECT